MSPRRASATPEAPQHRGGFAPDGGWEREFDGSPLTTLVARLCLDRRCHEPTSPATFATLIRAGGFAEAFPMLVQWEDLSEGEDWLVVAASNAAEECLKRGGYALGFVANNGRALDPAKVRHEFVQMTPEVVASNRAKLRALVQGGPIDARARRATGRSYAVALEAEDAPPEPEYAT